MSSACRVMPSLIAVIRELGRDAPTTRARRTLITAIRAATAIAAIRAVRAIRADVGVLHATRRPPEPGSLIRVRPRDFLAS